MLILYTLHLSCSHVGHAVCRYRQKLYEMTRCRCSLCATTTYFLLESQHRRIYATHAPQWILYQFCILSVLSDDYNDDNTINSLYARFILFTQYTVRRASRVNSCCVYMVATITLRFVVHVFVTYSTAAYGRKVHAYGLQYIFTHNACKFEAEHQFQIKEFT